MQGCMASQGTPGHARRLLSLDPRRLAASLQPTGSQVTAVTLSNDPMAPARFTQPHPAAPRLSQPITHTVHWTDHRCLLESSQTISKPPTHSDVLLLLSLTPLYPLLPLFFFFARPPSTCLLVVSEASSPPPLTPPSSCVSRHKAPLAPSATPSLPRRQSRRPRPAPSSVHARPAYTTASLRTETCTAVSAPLDAVDLSSDTRPAISTRAVDQ